MKLVNDCILHCHSQNLPAWKSSTSICPFQNIADKLKSLGCRVNGEQKVQNLLKFSFFYTEKKNQLVRTLVVSTSVQLTALTKFVQNSKKFPIRTLHLGFSSHYFLLKLPLGKWMLSKDGEIERTVLTPGQLPGMEQPLSLQVFSSGIKEFFWKSNSFPRSVTALWVSPSTVMVVGSSVSWQVTWVSKAGALVTCYKGPPTGVVWPGRQSCRLPIHAGF